MIHVIGDSHVYQFTGVQWASRSYEYYTENNKWQVGKYDPFHTYWLGPYTCFKFMEKCSETIDGILLKFWKPGDNVIFSCGEIDCRCHIPKHKPEFFEDTAQATQVVVNKYLEILKKWGSFSPIPLLCPPHPWCEEFNSMLISVRKDAWHVMGKCIDGHHFDARIKFIERLQNF